MNCPIITTRHDSWVMSIDYRHVHMQFIGFPHCKEINNSHAYIIAPRIQTVQPSNTDPYIAAAISYRFFVGSNITWTAPIGMVIFCYVFIGRHPMTTAPAHRSSYVLVQIWLDNTHHCWLPIGTSVRLHLSQINTPAFLNPLYCHLKWFFFYVIMFYHG